MKQFLQFLVIPMLLVATLALADGGSPGLSTFLQWGMPGDMALTGDFDGDGKADLVSWRPADGVWYIRRSGNNYSVGSASSYQWGLPGDIPQIADFNGDGRADFVVYRPTDRTWYVSFNRLYP